MLSHSTPFIGLRCSKPVLPAQAEKTERNQNCKGAPTKYADTLPPSNWVVASFVRGWGSGKELNVLSNLQLI